MRLTAATLTVGIVLSASAVGTSPALAADGACASANGVTVIVDASGLDAGIVQRCAEGEPTSGFDVLVRAGLKWAPVSNSPALLCRIEGLPGTDRESCVDAPPLNAYWAYFRADRGGEWKYSQSGAHTKPQPGSVVGWVFLTGVQRVPALAPPAVLPSPTPTPTPTPTQSPQRATPKPTVSHAPSETPAPNAGTDAAEEGVGDSGVAADAAPRPTSTRVGDAAQLGPPTQIKLGSPPSHQVSDESGSLMSFIVGAGTALGLLGAAGVMEFRRRRRI